jgi:hypothetical protein
MADARLGAQSDEVLSDGSPSRQLAAISAESLTNASNGAPTRQFAALSVEVLVPARLGFAGWGEPMITPVWS